MPFDIFKDNLSLVVPIDPPLWRFLQLSATEQYLGLCLERQSVGLVASSPFSLAGLGGGSASGKTTVATMIIEALDVPWVVLLSMDSFYKVRLRVVPARLLGLPWPLA